MVHKKWFHCTRSVKEQCEKNHNSLSSHMQCCPFKVDLFLCRKITVLLTNLALLRKFSDAIIWIKITFYISTHFEIACSLLPVVVCWSNILSFFSRRVEIFTSLIGTYLVSGSFPLCVEVHSCLSKPTVKLFTYLKKKKRYFRFE